MNRKLKVILVFIGICLLHTWINYHPVILASFDEGKYVEGEVFKPVNATFDFRKFSLNSSQSGNFTTLIDTSGFAQLVDFDGNVTINVFEWDKMTNARRERTNSSLMLEFEKQNRTVDNITVFKGDYLNLTFYSAYVYDGRTNTGIYVATGSEAETVGIVESLKFRGDV